MTVHLTRMRAAVLGCGLAIAGCLVTPTLHSQIPQTLTFRLPESVGPWKLQQRGKLQQSELKILQASDHCRCIYHCRETKQVLVVTLIAGPRGPLVSHQPEICYARDEFSAHSEATLWSLASRRDEFRLQTLMPRQVERSALTIAYAWYDGDCWRAPDHPRFRFAGHEGLQRMQVSMPHPVGMTAEACDAIQQFIQLTIDAAEAAPTQLVTNTRSSY